MKNPLAVLWLCLLLVGGLARAIDAEPPLQDPEREALYQKLVHEVRCLVCQNQTVGDSTAPLAADLRRELRRLVMEGQSEDEIKRFLLDRYGDFVLYKPQFSGATALLWLAPVIFLGAGVGILLIVVYRRRSLPVDIDADATGPETRG